LLRALIEIQIRDEPPATAFCFSWSVRGSFEVAVGGACRLRCENANAEIAIPDATIKRITVKPCFVKINFLIFLTFPFPA
jgi:hypothetical protein